MNMSLHFVYFLNWDAVQKRSLSLWKRKILVKVLITQFCISPRIIKPPYGKRIKTQKMSNWSEKGYIYFWCHFFIYFIYSSLFLCLIPSQTCTHAREERQTERHVMSKLISKNQNLLWSNRWSDYQISGTSLTNYFLYRYTSQWSPFGTSRYKKNTKHTSVWGTWVKSWNFGCLVTWFCYQLIANPGNKTAAVPWPDPHMTQNITGQEDQLRVKNLLKGNPCLKCWLVANLEPCHNQCQ